MSILNNEFNFLQDYPKLPKNGEPTNKISPEKAQLDAKSLITKHSYWRLL